MGSTMMRISRSGCQRLKQMECIGHVAVGSASSAKISLPAGFPMGSSMPGPSSSPPCNPVLHKLGEAYSWCAARTLAAKAESPGVPVLELRAIKGKIKRSNAGCATCEEWVCKQHRACYKHKGERNDEEEWWRG